MVAPADMPTPRGAADPAALWQSQPTPPFRLSPAAVAAAEREHARLRRAVGAKSAVMAVALVVALGYAVAFDLWFVRLFCLAAAAGYAHVLYNLRRARQDDADGVAAERAGAGLAAPSLAHYRAALARERDRLTGPRLWLPFAVAVPAMLVLLLGMARMAPGLRPALWLILGAFAVAMPLALVVGRRRARWLQARIDDLDALTRGA